MSDEWRVELELEEEQHGGRVLERLRTHDLDDEARKRLGEKVTVTRDGPRIFLYAGTEENARHAERIVRDLVAADKLSARISVTRWHPDEGAWKDALIPLPATAEEHAAERERHEEAARREAAQSGDFDWEVRVDAPSLREARELAARLSDEGLSVHRRWKHLLVGAPTEEDARELAQRIRAEAPADVDIRAEATPTEHPAFVVMEAAKPGIARDLGL